MKECFDLRLLAEIVGAQMGLRVVVGEGLAIGPDPSGHMVMTVPAGYRAVGEEEVKLLRGGVAHEAVGHGRHTDFKAKRGPSELHRALENALEDARIERAAWKVYPKCRRMLDESMAILLKRGGIRRAATEKDDGAKAVIAVLLRLMCEELGYCKGLIDWKEDWAVAEGVFGAAVMAEVWVKALEGHQKSNTAEVIQVAAAIAELLKRGYASAEQCKGQGGKGQSGQGEQQGQGSGDPQGKPEESESAAGQGLGQDEGEEKSAGAGEGAQAQGAQGAREAKSQEKGQGQDGEGRVAAAGGTVNGSRELNLNGLKAAQFDRGNAVQVLLTQQVKPRSDNAMGGIHMKHAGASGGYWPSATAKAAFQKLSSALMERLRTTVEDEDDSAAEQGTLSTGRLVNAVLGERDVFFEPGRPGEELDTAVSLLIDGSGSMNQAACGALALYQVCAAASWAIGSTLNGYRPFGAAFSMASFDSMLTVMKDWNEPWQRGAVLGLYGPTGSTLTYQAVSERLRDLAVRPEARKILFLITDGDIGDLSPLVKSAKFGAMELIVMMIGSPGAADPEVSYLKKFTRVDPANLGREMLRAAVEMF